MEYIPTIGLEIHVELKTKTKMFCNCFNDPNEKHPNINICPICMGHPGTLPVINEEAVKKVLMVGTSLNGRIPEYSQFDRKNYFYPDLPKGYQISQYKYPLVEGGELNGVKIIRIHLEEDTGKLVHMTNDHDDDKFGHSQRSSLVDFNRAGVPLMELVTEPVITSAEEARKFSEELQLILRYLDVSDANMEKGQMRIEINISIRPNDTLCVLGTKVEIKNLNSFRAVEEAIKYEIKRQAEILKRGEKIIQETRGWDENKGLTFSQREKEESHDYRYFPEPDLPPLEISNLKSPRPRQATRPRPSRDEVGKRGGQISNLIELPAEKRKRFREQFNLKDEQIEILISDKKAADYFEKVASELDEDSGVLRLAVNYLTSDLLGLMKEKMLNFDDLLATPENFAELINTISKNEISSRVAKDVLRTMVETGGDPSLIVEERGLEQIGDDSYIRELCHEIVNENSSAVADYKKGKENALEFLVGQAMRKTKGASNPEILKKTFLQILKEL